MRPDCVHLFCGFVCSVYSVLGVLAGALLGCPRQALPPRHRCFLVQPSVLGRNKKNLKHQIKVQKFCLMEGKLFSYGGDCTHVLDCFSLKKIEKAEQNRQEQRPSKSVVLSLCFHNHFTISHKNKKINAMYWS